MRTWREWMTVQGLSDKEIKDVAEFYNIPWNLDKQIDIKAEQEWEIELLWDADKWYNSFKEDFMEKQFKEVPGEFFMSLFENIPVDKFCMAFAEYQMDAGDAYVCYCPSTNRIIFFCH